MRIHYQSLEGVKHEEMESIRRITGEYNRGMPQGKRVKLWKKSDILECLTPKDARWGFTRVNDERELKSFLRTLKSVSDMTPGISWLIYEEESGKEFMLKG
jgi:hypothetical protein